MNMNESQRALPPIPDPQTGEPRPPRAPRSFNGDEITPVDTAPRAHPAIPDGRGPILEWSQSTSKSAIVAGVVMALIACGLPTVNSGSFHWMTAWWWWWLLVLAFGFVGYKAMSKMWLAAGSGWVQNSKWWVDTYRLTEIKVGAAGVNQVLRLKDSAGRECSLKLREVQRNQALWDLVYNGVLHSVVNGQASPPSGTRKILALPE